LVAAVDADIFSIKDLKGKRVNIRKANSLEGKTAHYALAAAGVDYERDINKSAMKTSEAVDLFCEGGIDAFFVTVGHPSGYISHATSCERKSGIIPITNTEKLIEEYPYFVKSKIPINWYAKAKNSKNIETVGLWTTLVTSVNVPDDVVYRFTKEIFENFTEFKKGHPSRSMLTKHGMLESLHLPIHPGALRYYNEVGLELN
jgi:TRAP transporter TAXI family solute receptor